MQLHVSGPVRNGLEERLRFSEGFEDRRVNLVHRVPFRSADLEYFALYSLRLHSTEGRDPGQSTPASSSVWRIAGRVCRMMGVVSRGPVYYDLFEEFADLAPQGMCPIAAPDGRGREDSCAVQQGSTSPTHVPSLAVSFRRPTTWSTFPSFRKAA